MLSSNKVKSNFFRFDKKFASDDLKVSNYLGWNSLNIAKFDIIKNTTLNNVKIDSWYPNLKKEQKIFLVTKGSLEFNIENKKNILTKFDAFDLNTKNLNYEISVNENSTFFIIGASNSNKLTEKNFCFNFKKDLETKDLWGGQCISRPYEGSGLTLVLFDLKNGFEFEDKGHINEQITWLIEGKMNFYADGQSKILTPENGGIDIGPYHVHGGVSGGAIGFDAFFPKREETKYRV